MRGSSLGECIKMSCLQVSSIKLVSYTKQLRVTAFSNISSISRKSVTLLTITPTWWRRKLMGVARTLSHSPHNADFRLIWPCKTHSQLSIFHHWLKPEVNVKRICKFRPNLTEHVISLEQKCRNY